MRLNKPSSRVIATGIAASAALALAVGAPAATAAPSPSTNSTDSGSTTASPTEARSLAADLGPDRTAGVHLTGQGSTPVVNVTDQEAAAKIESSGAKARVVTYSTKQLNSVKNAIDETGVTAGSSWAVDPVSNSVTVTTDASVTDSELSKVKSKLAKYGDKVEYRTTNGTISTTISGGESIESDVGTCSLGFNVVYSDNPDKHAFLTAGHCGDAGTSWSDGSGTALGETADSSFPGDDFSIVDYGDDVSDYPSAVGDQEIDSSGTPTVGEQVTRTGQTTGTEEGEVLELDATVEYEEGTVEGLIHTDVCAEPGDSGGSLYSGSTAYGLTSGGSGDCTSGGETYFQPVEEALDNFGVEVG